MLTKFRVYVAFTICIIIAQSGFSQVRTKIFKDSIPVSLKPMQIYPKETVITEPADLSNRKNKAKYISNKLNYDNSFALSKPVDIDLVRSAAIKKESGFIYYSLTLKAENALNVSLHFNRFFLSKNAVLSLYNDFELTDSITANENNGDNVWASRVYQGDRLNILLKIPESEIGTSQVIISMVNFGYIQFGTEYLGRPGTSASCNINVACPLGNGWENEKRSVALIVAGENNFTGALVMNTCNTNIPNVLTANHAVNGTNTPSQYWVFLFQYWSVECNRNTGMREDIQFNGCRLKSRSAATDFALLELNQYPRRGSGITYSGWNNSPLPATETVVIHHPRGDVMKISKDYQAPRAGPWVAGASNHWTAVLDDGIAQHGSSGAPLYDAKHLIVGQLHGNSINTCAPTEGDDCWCREKFPTQYGRFDVSWPGGGRDTNRLSNWLDPLRTGTSSIGTTSIDNLKNAFLELTIDGWWAVCSGPGVFNLIGAPVGSPVMWTISDPSVANLSYNGTQATLTRIGQAHGEVTLTATVNDICYRNTTVSIRVLIGGFYGDDIVIDPGGNNGCFDLLGLYDLHAVPRNTQSNYTMSWEWSYLQVRTDIPTSWQTLPCSTAICHFSFAEEGDYQIRLMSKDACGFESVSYRDISIKGSCNGGGWLSIRVQPNPVKDRLTAYLEITDQQKLKNSQAATVKMIDKSGIVYYKQDIMLKEKISIDINTLHLLSGSYFLVVESATGIISKQFIKID